MLVDYEGAILAGDVWVLVEGEETTGVLVMRPEKGYLFVETGAVRPDRQGSGLGRRLMAYAENAARGQGIDEIRLYTNENMT